MRNLAVLTGLLVLAGGLAACSSSSSTTAAVITAPTSVAPTSSPPSPSPSPSPSSSPTTPIPATPAPTPVATTAALPAPTAASGAWCKATASVYYAPDDENNVYVNSDRPYTSATASADGYSWSYETNGSGYALIYLNGPPPGAEITVTVGGATCTTSD